jgi:type IV secretion system protein VirB4
VVDSADVRDIEQAVAVTARLEPEDHNLTNIYGHITRTTLREELRVWIRAENGSLGKYFDNATDSFSLSQVSGFELGKILENKQVAQPFTEMLFYRIDQHLLTQIANGIVTPTMIFIPEVWNLISQPAYARKLIDWLKTLAKRNCALWMDTQSLEDAASSDEVKGLFPALRDNIKNMVFVPNDKALTDSAAKFYRGEFSLQDEQLNLIARGRPRRDYLIRQEIGGQEVFRMVHLTLSARELAFLRSDTPAQICLNKYLARNRPVEDWLDDFIDEMSIPASQANT